MPFPYSISDFTAEMPAVVRDEANRLTANGITLDRYVKQAITERYSQDAPLEVVSDLAGGGTNYIDAPAAFEIGFSILRSIEYPIGQVPPELLADSDIQIYRTPTATQLIIASNAIAIGESVRASWTSRHNADGSTVPDKDFYAVVDYASSLALQSLAAIYVQVGDASMSADTVNYRTKSQEYLALAKEIRRRYFNHFGISEDEIGKDGGTGAALSLGNLHQNMNSGVDRLIHPKGTR